MLRPLQSPSRRSGSGPFSNIRFTAPIRGAFATAISPL